MGRAARQGLFFQESKDAFAGLERSHDLFWGAAISVWNLRADVAGIRHIVPDIEQKDLAARFAAGSGINGSNVVTMIDRLTWEDQLEELAVLRLVTVFAHYEGWLEAVLERLGVSEKTRRNMVPQMTGPNERAKPLAKLGASTALGELVKDAPRHRYRVDSDLGAFLTCARYFKEVRNSVVHRGRRADKRLLEAQTDYERSISNGGLGHYKAPLFVPISGVGERVSVDHHGVIGFTGVVYRLIATFDSMFLQTHPAEAIYVSRWKDESNPARSAPRTDPRRQQYLAKMARKVGPEPKPFPASVLNLLLSASAL